jgi:hypothetical protein
MNRAESAFGCPPYRTLVAQRGDLLVTAVARDPPFGAVRLPFGMVVQVAQNAAICVPALS